MSSKIFVGNFPYPTEDADLNEFFSRFGTVEEAKVIRDRVTGRSRGYAFVKFEAADSAERAVQEANDTDLNGRPLRVDFANIKEAA